MGNRPRWPKVRVVHLRGLAAGGQELPRRRRFYGGDHTLTSEEMTRAVGDVFGACATLAYNGLYLSIAEACAALGHDLAVLITARSIWYQSRSRCYAPDELGEWWVELGECEAITREHGAILVAQADPAYVSILRTKLTNRRGWKASKARNKHEGERNGKGDPVPGQPGTAPEGGGEQGSDDGG